MRKKFLRLHPGSKILGREYYHSPIAHVVESSRKRSSPPFDRSKVAPANKSETPQMGKDPRAVAKHPSPKENPCEGCRWFRARTDWSHNRIIGTCYFPFDEPTIWDCDACMHHLPRSHPGHTGTSGECRWGQVGQHSEPPNDDRSPSGTVENTRSAVVETPPSEEGGSLTSPNIRWVFNDQGVRYAVDSRVYPEGEEPFNQYGRLSDIFPPEAGYDSE